MCFRSCVSVLKLSVTFVSVLWQHSREKEDRRSHCTGKNVCERQKIFRRGSRVSSCCLAARPGWKRRRHGLGQQTEERHHLWDLQWRWFPHPQWEYWRWEETSAVLTITGSIKRSIYPHCFQFPPNFSSKQEYGGILLLDVYESV